MDDALRWLLESPAVEIEGASTRDRCMRVESHQPRCWMEKQLWMRAMSDIIHASCNSRKISGNSCCMWPCTDTAQVPFWPDNGVMKWEGGTARRGDLSAFAWMLGQSPPLETYRSSVVECER